jgi:methyl-accepting chemotaxis protein
MHQNSVMQAAPSAEAEDLLERWLALGELDRRAFLVMTRELTGSCTDLEASVVSLSTRFQELAASAQAQVGRVQAIVEAAQSIEANGKRIQLSDATRFIEDVLVKVIDTVLAVSKHAMRMVYALEDVAKDVDGAEKCVTQIHTINKQTRFLALNAAIEARRAGANGAAFEVIAHEIKELAKDTDRTAKDVSERIGSVAAGVRRGHAVLQEIATIDMSEHIIAKDQLDALLTGIVAQNETFRTILADAMTASTDLSATIGPLIVSLQFQDRVTQHLTHVIDALAVLQQASSELQEETRGAIPGRFEGTIDAEWVRRIVDQQTLGAVRQRFLAQLLSDNPGDPGELPAMEAEAANDDIELF